VRGFTSPISLWSCPRRKSPRGPRKGGKSGGKRDEKFLLLLETREILVLTTFVELPLYKKNFGAGNRGEEKERASFASSKALEIHVRESKSYIRKSEQK